MSQVVLWWENSLRAVKGSSWTSGWEVWIWPKEHPWPFYPAKTPCFPKDTESCPHQEHTYEIAPVLHCWVLLSHMSSAQPYTWLLWRHVTLLLYPQLHLIQKNCLLSLPTFRNVIFLKLPHKRPWSQKLYLCSFGGKCLQFLGQSTVAGMRYSTYPEEYHLTLLRYLAHSIVCNLVLFKDMFTGAESDQIMK